MRGVGVWQGNVRRRSGGLQESCLANLTLNVHGLLVDFGLGFGDLDVGSLAVALGCCFGSLYEKVLLASDSEKFASGRVLEGWSIMEGRCGAYVSHVCGFGR